MTGLKYYERIKLLIELIEARKTGSPKELAKKLEVRERSVYRILDDLKLVLEKDIAYCRESRSYIFPERKIAD